MKIGMKSIVTTILMMCFAAPAWAVQELVLELNDQQFRTQGETNNFPLKRSFREKFPTIDWDRYELKRIDVVTKSRNGNGQMWLEVGDDQSANAAVAGERDAFESNAPRTFREYGFNVPTGADGSKGWRLAMRGNFRVRFIKATLNDCHQGECEFRSAQASQSGASIVRVLDMDDAEIGPGEQTIYLKRLLREAYPRMNFDNMEFASVTLVGKSRQGRGRVALRVGDVTTDPSNLGGSQSAYNSRSADTFYPLSFNRPAGATADNVWQLLLEGRFRVREIQVGMERIKAGAANSSRQNSGNNKNNKKNDKKKNRKAADKEAAACRASDCPKGKRVAKRAKGARSCYQSGDGRYIDRREGALVLYSEGCKQGKCVQKRQQCYESRTCVCANGSGRYKEANSCGAPRGCAFGYATLKMHCGSDIFDVN